VRCSLIAQQARIHFLRGNLCFPRSDIDGCLRDHGMALKLARRTGAGELEAMALGGLGDAEYLRGRMVSAHDRFRKCVQNCERHGFGRIEVANRPMMAFTQWYAGDTRGALVVADAAIRSAPKTLSALKSCDPSARRTSCPFRTFAPTGMQRFYYRIRYLPENYGRKGSKRSRLCVTAGSLKEDP
jgi:hypothetical protein